MNKIILMVFSLALIFGLVAYDKESTETNMNDTNGKLYTYEGEGFGGDFTIQINDDGSSVFYEGYLSSYMGISNWTMNKNIMTISDGIFTNKFRVDDNELVFIEEGSTNFLFIKLKDGEKFVRDLKKDIDIPTMIEKEENEMNEFVIEVNNKELIVRIEDNSSAKTLIEKLKEGDVVIDAHDYGNFEKVGELGFELPRNDKQITTKVGDVILYQGTEITLYYDTNSWNFTKLGEVINIDGSELKELLGKGNVTMTLKLKD